MSVQVSLWDTAGLERFPGSPFYSHYRRATGALLVYSVEDPRTFETLQDWITEATHFVEPLFKWALIGNKCDLSSEIDSRRVEARCDQLQVTVSYAVSAKTGHNVKKAFNDLVAAIHRSNKQQNTVGHGRSFESSIQLNGDTLRTQSKQCCT